MLVEPAKSELSPKTLQPPRSILVVGDGPVTWQPPESQEVRKAESLESLLDDPGLDTIVLTPGQVKQLIEISRNNALDEQQKKLDALHQAGWELAALEVHDLAAMSEIERVAILKDRLRSQIHALLHYDTIEVRLLDQQTLELKPLLQDGMTPEAAKRVLYAKNKGNGITGYVGSTRKSYLCPDTSKDPHFLQGAGDTRSSMTVPLIYNEQLVGTLNVESPIPNFFGPNDLQFTELYSKEIANALHTLELLAAQTNCASWQALDMVNREIVMPVDDVLASSAVLLKRGVDDDSRQHLQRIASNARAVRDSIHKVATLVTCLDPAVQAQQILIGKRVLVIEQDERTRKSAHMILEKLGAGVDTAGNAEAGIAMLSLAHYDAVFMEVRPIDMGGYDTYCKLREARPGVRIAMTNSFSHDPAHSYVRAKQDGLRFYILKPFKQEQMVNVLLAPSPGDSCAIPKPVSVSSGSH